MKSAQILFYEIGQKLRTDMESEGNMGHFCTNTKPYNIPQYCDVSSKINIIKIIYGRRTYFLLE